MSDADIQTTDADKDYSAGFNAGLTDGATGISTKVDPEAKEVDGGDATPDPKEAKEVDDTPKDPPAPTGVEKALADTKAWSTKLSQENSELRAKIDLLAAQIVAKAEPPKSPDAPAPTLDGIDPEDYPELAPLFKALDKQTAKLAEIEKKFEKVDALDRKVTAKTEQEAIRETFDRDITPVVAKEHPEIVEILADVRKNAEESAYWKWAAAQSPMVQFAALESVDPRDIAYAVGLYKTANGIGTPAPKEPDAVAKAKAKALASLPSGSNKQGAPSGRPAADATPSEWTRYYLDHPDEKPT